MFGLGSQELLVILVIVLILFGANRLPQIARSLGSSMKEFKKGLDEAKTEDDVPLKSTEPVSPAVGPACLQCGTPLAQDWSHCPRCGTAILRSPTSPAQP